MSQGGRWLSQEELELSKDPDNILGVECIGSNSTAYQFNAVDGVRVETKFTGSERRERIESNCQKGTSSGREREHRVVLYWLFHVNKVWGTDYDFASDGEGLDDQSADAVIARPSHPESQLKLQVTSSDHDQVYRQQVARHGSGARVERGSGATHQRIKEALLAKQHRYGRKGSQDLILLLDAWPGLTERDIKVFLAAEQEFISALSFSQVWVVSIEADFVRQIT